VLVPGCAHAAAGLEIEIDAFLRMRLLKTGAVHDGKGERMLRVHLRARGQRQDAAAMSWNSSFTFEATFLA
jgi:hypothetical protein